LSDVIWPYSKGKSNVLPHGITGHPWETCMAWDKEKSG